MVLNKSWVAVGVADVRRALTLVILEAAQVVDPINYATYDFEDWMVLSQETNGCHPKLRSTNFSINIPEIITLCQFNRCPNEAAKFSPRYVYQRDGHTCQYCGVKSEKSKLTLDHVHPRSKGGPTTWENVVVACQRCNTKKGGRLTHEIGMFPKNNPIRPAWATRLGLMIGPRPPEAWKRFLPKSYA